MTQPTMEDVAALAGVSRALVSLVMRDSPKVSAARREAVLRAAAELGYRPNAMARSLASRRSSTLGVLISDLHNPYFAEVFDGVEAVARQHGLDLIMNSGGRRPQHERLSVENLLSFQPAGLVLLGPVVEAAVIERASGVVPITLVARSTRLSTVDTVNDDGAHGSELAVEHLVSLGHERIVHFDGGIGSQSALRRRGYERAMRRLGLASRIHVVSSEYTESAGEKAAHTVLGLDELPTAILAANDVNAIGVITEFESQGVRVPDDVSVVGYDNTHLSAMRHLSLTTMDQPRQEMGRLAAEAVLQRLRGERTEPVRHLLRPSLVVRNTTAPPGGKQ